MEKIELNGELGDRFIEVEPLTMVVPGYAETGMCSIQITTHKYELLAGIVLSAEAAIALAEGLIRIAEASKK